MPGSTRTLLLAALLPIAVVPGGVFGTPPVHTEDPERSFCTSWQIDKIKRVDHQAYFATQDQAIDVAAQIDETVFKLAVRAAASGPDWLLDAAYRKFPSQAVFEQQESIVRGLVKAHGGRLFTSGCLATSMGSRRAGGSSDADEATQ